MAQTKPEPATKGPAGQGDTPRTSTEQGPAAPAGPRDADARKQQILTHGTPSTVRTIADALVMKDGDLFLVTAPTGALPGAENTGCGLYYHDCRYLRAYEIHLQGQPPTILGATARAGCTGLFELTNPDLTIDGRPLQKETLGLTWTRDLDGDDLVLHDRLVVRNYGHAPVRLTLGFQFDACFEDVFVIRGLLDAHTGHPRAPEWDDGLLRFLYEGGDRTWRSLTVALPTGVEQDGDRGALLTLDLDARESRQMDLRLAIAETPDESRARPHVRREAPGRPDRPPRPVHDDWPAARIRTEGVLLEDLIHRSFRDLALLRSSLEGHGFVAAGIPWFGTLFGRDSLIAAYQVLAYAPAVAASTLRLLAHYQGTKVDDWRDEQPGKILHELRVGELARMGAIPHTPYYGSIDATPLFLLLLAHHAEWSGSLELFHELHGNVERALRWIDDYGDLDGDGFVEYASRTTKGLINQGWKDSGDAIIDARGRIAEPPIALVEVQAYVYAAKRCIAGLYRRAGEAARADALDRAADALRERFEQAFWVESLGCYALALDGKKRPLDVVTSNPGHALWCGIAAPERAQRTADRLFRDDMYSGWGVRTLAATACGYNPIAYHLGTVWPHDNSLIAVGLRRYGRDAEAHRVFSGLTEAALHFDQQRLPELFTGLPRAAFGEPIRYPVACHPQAWAAGSVPLLIATLLGLEAEGFEHRLRVVRPMLPEAVDWMELHGVRVGGAEADLRFERRPDRSVAVHTLAVRGELEITTDTEARGPALV
ncbi:MAG TPA: glycogen debranching N-terminal domain-containing protein [Gemmatimonadales bacterium]|nr:glycogen debranching N-terminal domain-containing protein [Gemmatimonadales bacterium]